jgi:trimeric autotransporter adhesin
VQSAIHRLSNRVIALTRAIFFLSLFALSLFAYSVQAATAKIWSSKFFPTGPDQEVVALHTVGNTLYTAGAYHHFGTFTHQGIMKWDGESWAPVGPTLAGRISAMTIDSLGKIFVVGELKNGTLNYGFAYWAGGNWIFPESGRGFYSHGSLTIAGERLYLIGPLRKDIYQWDGESLTPLEALTASGEIHGLTTRNGDLIAAGSFEAIGDIPAKNIAQYRDGQWKPMGNGLALEAKCLINNNGTLWAAGAKLHDGVRHTPALAKWDGSNWVEFVNSPGDSGIISKLAVFGQQIVAAGSLYGISHYAFAHWDGTQWRQQGQGILNYDIQDLAWVNGVVWVAGRFSHPKASYLSRWAGGEWKSSFPQTTLAPAGRIQRLAVQNQRLVGGGIFESRHLDSISLLAEWNGTGWVTAGPTFPEEMQYSVQVSALMMHEANTYLAIRSQVASSYQYKLYVRMRDELVFLGSADGPIFALCMTPQGLVAGGQFNTMAGIPVNRVALWNGQAWQPLGGGLGQLVTALEWDGEGLVAADMTRIGNQLGGKIWRWSAGQWRVLARDPAALFDRDVQVLRKVGNTIWAGGDFSVMDAAPTRGIAQWDGSSWRQVGQGLGGVNDLTLGPDGEVYAAGNFQQPSMGLALWSGSQWVALGQDASGNQGMNGFGNSLVWYREGLVVSGPFTQVGSHPVAGVARWSADLDPMTLGIRPRPRYANQGRLNARFFQRNHSALLGLSSTHRQGHNMLGRVITVQPTR